MDIQDKNTEVATGGENPQPSTPAPTSASPSAEATEDKKATADKPVEESPLRQFLAAIIVVSVLAGAAGGAGASILAMRKGWLPASGSGAAFSGSQSQQVTLNEDSAIVDVVKKSSPAVVSIIVSKDISQVPGLGLNPFDMDPFWFFGQPAPNNRNDQDGQGENLQQVGAGSGFFVSSDGLILTNKHVVDDTQASYSVITNDGKSYSAKVLARDPINDLAIVKVDIKDAPHLSLADSSQVQIGQRVVAIGNSLGQYQNTVTSGIVSGIGRSITAGSRFGSEQLSGVIQTDAAINPGNSGGPLLNVLGQVVGINTAIDQQGQLVGFALPANVAKKALDSFEKNGKILRPYLGIRYVVITHALAQEQKLPKDYGALLVRGQNMTDFAVIPGSPADKAGLQENDIILSINGQTIDQDHTLSSVLQNYNSGDTIRLRVYHRGSEKDMSVTLGQQ